MFKHIFSVSKRCFCTGAKLVDHDEFFIRKAVGDSDLHRALDLLKKDFLPVVKTVFEDNPKELDPYLAQIQKNHVLLVAIAKQAVVEEKKTLVSEGGLVGSIALSLRVNVVEKVFNHGNYFPRKAIRAKRIWKPDCIGANDSYLDLLVTSEHFRSLGVGTNLTKSAIEIAQKEGMERIFGHVSKKNEASLSILRKSVMQEIAFDKRAKDMEYLYGYQFPKPEEGSN